MNCPSCESDLTADQRFCPQCGAEAAVLRCAGCHEPIARTARFCSECGVAASGSAGAVAEETSEQGIAAVLVVEWSLRPEVEAQLERAERVSLLQDAAALVDEILLRFDGRVSRRIGERIVALFGASSSDPDRSHLALEAALEIRDQLPTLPAANTLGENALNLRIAAHAEQVPAAVWRALEESAEGREDPTLFDAPADVATVLLDVAQPGEVIATRDLLGRHTGQFSIRDAGRGSEHAAIVLNASGVRMASGSVSSPHRTPFVSRDVELSFLMDRWTRASTHEAQAVLLRGEAGIGKSRLISRLRERLANQEYSWIEAQCDVETRSSPFRPITAIFEQILGLRQNDPDERIIERLEGALEDAEFPLDETMPLFARLLGVELASDYPAVQVGREEVRRKTLEWLGAWVVRISEEQPTALVFEDLHWSDPSTLEFIDHLIDLIRNDRARILLLLAAREEFRPDWSLTEQILLPRLSASEVSEMATAVASGRPMANVLTREVSLRSEGIPLFVEEFTQDVLEAEQNHESGPITIETSMLRRVARISDPEIARMASVIGLECSRQALQEVAQNWDALKLDLEIEKLVSAGLMHLRNDPNGLFYRFKHALVRDALYDDLKEDVRRDYHERVAYALKKVEASGAPGQPERVAYHFEQAGLTDRAIENYQRAADLAAKNSAHAEAILHLRSALNLLRSAHPEIVIQADGKASRKTKKSQELANRELALLVALGPSLLASHGYGNPQVAEVFERAQKLCDSVSEPAVKFRALYGLSTYHQARGSLRRSGELAALCLELATEIGEPALQLLSHQRVGLCNLYEGRIEDSLLHFEHALEFHDAVAHRAIVHDFGGDMGVYSRAYAALGYAVGGRPDRSRFYVRSALADAREGGHSHTLAFALAFCSIVMAVIGDRQRAEQLAQTAIEESEQYGFPLWSGIGHVIRGWARAFDPGRCAGAADEIEAALNNLERIGSTVGTATFYEMYAEIQLITGAEQGALDSLSTAMAFAESTQTYWWNPRILRLQGEILARRGQPKAARAALEQAIEVAERHGSRSLALGAASQLAAHLDSTGQTREAKAVLDRAWNRFAEGYETLPASSIADVIHFSGPDPIAIQDLQVASAALVTRLGADAQHISQLSAGSHTAPPGETKGTTNTEPSPNATLVAALTRRRLEVLRLVAKGLTNREIGGVLSISEHTAKAHVAGLLEALDLSNRTEAALALREYESAYEADAI